MANETPKTYKGYGDEKDANGNVTSAGTKLIITKTAADANNYVNPSEVKSALEELRDSMNGSNGGITRVQKALQNVAVDADGHMLSVEDATMHPTIEAVADSLSQASTSIDSLVSEIQEFAEKAHDNKQIEYNQQAEAEVRGTAGVTRVV